VQALTATAWLCQVFVQDRLFFGHAVECLESVQYPVCID
jgi:hypothetical protein